MARPPTSTITGTSGNDSLVGTSAADSISGLAGQDTLSGGAGADSLYGGDGNDGLSGGTEADLLDGGAGDDTLAGGSGVDTIYGGSGMDYLDYSASASGVSVNLNTGSALYGDAAGDVLAGVDGIIGSSGADTLTGFDGQSTSGDIYTNIFYGGGGNDSLDGLGGDDKLYGGADGDTVLGGAGNDLVQGDAGADSVYGGEGADSLYGGSEGDRLYGDAGADLLAGGDGDDTAYGGADGDALSGDAGADALYGGEGADGLTGGAGDDLLSGEDGTDKLDGGEGADTLYGGAEGDYLSGGAGSDLLSGGSGNDTILSGDDADRIEVAQGDGQDLIQGGEGGKGTDSDTLAFSGKEGVTVRFGAAEAGEYKFADGTSGTFTEIERVEGTEAGDRLDASGVKGAVDLSGGGGDDTLAGGFGDDTLTGGEGQDSFGLGGGSDLVTDFDLSEVDGQTADQLDVSELTNPDGSPVRAWDVKITEDTAGNAVLTFPEGETVTLKGVTPEMVEKAGGVGKLGVPCFAGRTRIAVPGGWRAVEEIAVGDLVQTAAGPMPVVWCGSRRLDAAALEARPEQRPIRLKVGQFGLVRDLVVSPQHGIALGGALIRARHLAEFGRGAHVARGLRAVVYHHLMLPQHALLRAEGAWAESFYPGEEALRMLAPQDRAALVRAADLAAYGPRCLPLLAGREARARLAGVAA